MGGDDWEDLDIEDIPLATWMDIIQFPDQFPEGLAEMAPENIKEILNGAGRGKQQR